MLLLTEIENLIFELQKLGTVSRIFKYGPISTMHLAFYRFFNSSVISVIDDFLEKIDNAILHFNSIGYKASKYVSRVDVGELVNVAKQRTNADESTLSEIFDIIAKYIINLCYCYIDELQDNKVNIKSVNSLSALIFIEYNGTSRSIISELYKGLNNLFSDKPTSMFSITSELAKYKIDRAFKQSVLSKIDLAIDEYVTKKQSKVKFGFFK